jgi:hypothetical protein
VSAFRFKTISETDQVAKALLAAVVCGLMTTQAVAQNPPPSALVNQRSEDTLEAARAASPHTPDETYAYFEDEAQSALEQAIARVWDPERAREPTPRKPWGDPDIEGYWVSATYTPMERPAELEGKPFYTPQEAIETFQRAVVGDVATDPAVVHYDWTEFGMDNWQSPIRPNLRTSLIVDPPNGRKPRLTENGQAQHAANAPRHTLESRNLYERCITGDQGPPRVPSTQAVGESQIVQTPDYVLLVTQVNSEVRIIHLDNEPQASERVGSFLGYSRGHWEGDTLVVETTNFGPTARVRRIQEAGANLHLIERFTRVEEDLLIYEATLTDPTVWESPWTFEVPWPRMDPPGLFEWACHENNYGFINVIRGARVRAAEFADEQDNNP